MPPGYPIRAIYRAAGLSCEIDATQCVAPAPAAKRRRSVRRGSGDWQARAPGIPVVRAFTFRQRHRISGLAACRYGPSGGWGLQPELRQPLSLR